MQRILRPIKSVKKHTWFGLFSAFRLLGVIVWLVSLPTLTASALSIPEKLTYTLTWTGIKGGTATQEIIDEGNSIRVVSTARSADWISAFFPVDDRIESVLNKVEPPHLGLPQHYRMKVREGSHRRDKELIFDHKAKKAEYFDHLKGEKSTIDIVDNTYDAYSSFFYLRTMKLEVGKSVFVNILDNKKLWNVEVQVVKKEKLDTILGTINTVQVRPLMKSEGIFNRKGTIDIWLTDDERHIPVKMKTKITIGSITATLVKVN